MSVNDLTPAIQLLERKVNTLLSALNVLREEAGMPPFSPSAGGHREPGPGASMEIKPDRFFNKRQHTAIREYLELRHTNELGPAKPREIFEALKAGGFQYETKDDQVALVGLRSLLRRRTNVFIKVGDTGAYGLVSRYGKAKPTKGPSQAQEEAAGKEPDATETPKQSEETEAAAEDVSTAAA